MSTTKAAGQTCSDPIPRRYASHELRGNVWGRTRIDPLYDLDLGTVDSSEPQRWDGRTHRFLSHFSGPIIWTLEITVVVLIIVNHSVDFVDAVIVADLVIIVVMMAFRGALGLWKESHRTARIPGTVWEK